MDTTAASTPEPTRWAGLNLTPGYTKYNFLGLFCVILGQFTMLAYLNMQVVFMLKDPESYNVDPDVIGQVTNDLIAYPTLVSLVTTFFAGYIFDIFGRKPTIFVASTLMIVCFVAIPFTAPSLPALMALRILNSVFFFTVACTPLINDYVEPESRGKGVSYNTMSIIIAEILSIAVLFQFTKTLDFKTAFVIAGTTVYGIFLLALYLIKEPQVKSDHQNALSTGQQVRYLTRQVMKMIGENIAITVSFFSSILVSLMIVFTNTFILLWISSRVEAGILASQDEAKVVYQQLMIAGALVIVPTAVIVGRLSDIYEAKYSLTTGFLVRGLAMLIFLPLEDPRNPFTFIALVFAVMATVAENIVAHAYFYRNLQKETRGIMMALWSVAASMGVIVFSLVGGKLYDSYSEKAPFAMIAGCDLAFVLFLLVLIFKGKLIDSIPVADKLKEALIPSAP